ncbi:hypothetical protein M0765_014240 [Variovorax sp. S2]|uniref:hypothetical protein n=1 Tax=Variovorax sp. S12S4 TaxID=3029170 RepID=UPI00215D1844|nr:hypothetical protein [Variovorax sp. S12S4]MCR8958838.1 hypothetical protein [Variovorax sp. S12S4]
MFHPLPARWLAVFPAMAAVAAMAQPAPGEAPAAAPPALTYKSALEDYRPFTDEKPIPWKEANETVRQRGGWQAYAKEAAGGNSAGAEQPAKGKTEDPAAHRGHTMPMPPKKEQQP